MTFREIYLLGGSEELGLEARRTVGDQDRSPSRGISVCGPVGASGSCEEKDVVFPGDGSSPSSHESRNQTDPRLSYEVKISVSFITDKAKWETLAYVHDQSQAS